jgi:hypothetical protein
MLRKENTVVDALDGQVVSLRVRVWKLGDL